MAGQDGNPGNPLGLQTPAFNASFAFFLVFMGALGSYPLFSITQRPQNLTSDLHRPRLRHLPHLLPPHQHHLLPHLLLPRLRLRLPRRRILEPRSRLRERREHNGRQESRATRRCKSSRYLCHTSRHGKCFRSLTTTLLPPRRAAPSHSSHQWRAGGSSSPSCLRPWTFPSASPSATCPISSRERARSKRSRMPSRGVGTGNRRWISVCFSRCRCLCMYGVAMSMTEMSGCWGVGVIRHLFYKSCYVESQHCRAPISNLLNISLDDNFPAPNPIPIPQANHSSLPIPISPNHSSSSPSLPPHPHQSITCLSLSLKIE